MLGVRRRAAEQLTERLDETIETIGLQAGALGRAAVAALTLITAVALAALILAVVAIQRTGRLP